MRSKGPGCVGMVLVATGALALALIGRAYAHQGHDHPSPSPAALAGAPPADTDAGSQDAAAAAPEARPTPPPEIRVPLREALLEHLHNKVVHFPLALGCTAALLLLLSYRWPQYWPAARLLILLAAVSAVAAYFTGKAQEEDVENGPLRRYFELHESLGITSAIALWLGWALTLTPRARPWLWLYALLLLAFLSGTGFLGGILSHAAI
jgi:uncharacterized membrane protein